jgi:hypothetical protein
MRMRMRWRRSSKDLRVRAYGLCLVISIMQCACLNILVMACSVSPIYCRGSEVQRFPGEHCQASHSSQLVRQVRSICERIPALRHLSRSGSALIRFHSVLITIKDVESGRRRYQQTTSRALDFCISAHCSSLLRTRSICESTYSRPFSPLSPPSSS